MIPLTFLSSPNWLRVWRAIKCYLANMALTYNIVLKARLNYKFGYARAFNCAFSDLVLQICWNALRL